MKISELNPIDIKGLTVTFKEPIGDKESYAEAGMRAVVDRMDRKHDDLAVIYFNFVPFDDYNKQFESFNYYDKSGNPTLNARQAGFYKPVDHMYFGNDEVVEDMMSFDESLSTVKMFDFEWNILLTLLEAMKTDSSKKISFPITERNADAVRNLTTKIDPAYRDRMNAERIKAGANFNIYLDLQDIPDETNDSDFHIGRALFIETLMLRISEQLPLKRAETKTD